MVGVKHLVALVSALVQLVLEVGIAEVVQIQDPVDPDLVIALFSLVELHFFPLLMGRRIAPSRAVDEQILGQSLDRDDLLLVLDVECVEVTPEVLLLEALLDAADEGGELRAAEVALKKVLHHFLVDLLLHLLVLFIQLGQVGSLGQHLQPEELGAAVHSGVRLLLALLQLNIEGHLHGGEESVEEVIDTVSGIWILDVVRAVANPG